MADSGKSPQQRLAAAVQNACLQAAQTAYEQARMDGLCHEGAWEFAVSAMQRLDVEKIVREVGDRGSATGDWGGGVTQSPNHPIS